MWRTFPGYLVIEDVLTAETVSQINALIDEHAAFKPNGALVNEGSALAGTVRADGRHTMSGMLSWPEPLSAPFRELLWHPKLVPVLQTVLGDGYRLDNGPLVMTNSPGGGGQRLHGALLPLPYTAAAAAAAFQVDNNVQVLLARVLNLMRYAPFTANRCRWWV